MNQAFDLVVLGTGAAASVAASRCRGAGWRVAIVDVRPFGGTCALRGCDPKKVLVGAADAVDAIRRMAGHGITGDARLDWPALMRFKRSFTEPVPEARERALRESGIETFHGRARFVGRNEVSVGGDILVGRHVLIATGAMPAALRFPGADNVIDSTAFMELDVLPRRIVFIGGGYISFEFAHVAARAGAQVEILEHGEHPLKHFDTDLVRRLVGATRALGIVVRTKAHVEGVERASGGHLRVLASGERPVEADLVVHGAGRVPEIDDLDLVAAGVARVARGIAVNEFLQSTSNPVVYAAGDAAGTGAPNLTPVASIDGHVVAANLLEGNHRRPDPGPIPSAVFTSPALASVGLTAPEATQKGLVFEIHEDDTSSWYSSRRVAASTSAFKVLVEKGSERILGAHLLGLDAEQLVNVFAVAMRAGLPAPELKRTTFAYPSAAWDIAHML